MSCPQIPSLSPLCTLNYNSFFHISVSSFTFPNLHQQDLIINFDDQGPFQDFCGFEGMHHCMAFFGGGAVGNALWRGARRAKFILTSINIKQKNGVQHIATKFHISFNLYTKLLRTFILRQGKIVRISTLILFYGQTGL